jgi:acyl-CoA thioesterase I
VSVSIGMRHFAVALALVLAMGTPARSDPPTNLGSPGCATPTALSAIAAPLDRTASRIAAGKPLTIVAMGSSSTLGVGTTAPAMSYPSRLEQELKDRFPDTEIKVINHGIGGQDVPEELVRLERDVIAEHPDLVIWQVGTNAVLRRDDLSADEQLIGRGVALLKGSGIDLVLMDLQYAPRVLARPAAAEMERLIAQLAHHAHVGLFRRFEIMQEWDHTHQLAPAALIGADGLHMTDTSYGCLANQLAEALAWNWWSHGKMAKSPNRNPGAFARIEGSTGAKSGSPLREH